MTLCSLINTEVPKETIVCIFEIDEWGELRGNILPQSDTLLLHLRTKWPEHPQPTFTSSVPVAVLHLAPSTHYTPYDSALRAENIATQIQSTIRVRGSSERSRSLSNLHVLRWGSVTVVSLLECENLNSRANYTGCFTSCGYYRRRWFPRFLWSKKFI